MLLMDELFLLLVNLFILLMVDSRLLLLINNLLFMLQELVLIEHVAFLLDIVSLLIELLLLLSLHVDNLNWLLHNNILVLLILGKYLLVKNQLFTDNWLFNNLFSLFFKAIVESSLLLDLCSRSSLSCLFFLSESEL